MKKWIIIAAILAVACSSYGQLLTAGTQEVRLDGMIDFESAWGTDIDFNLGYGYFVLDSIEIGGGITLMNNDEWTAWGLSAFGEYNFDLGMELVPFAGVGLGWGTYDFDKGDSNSAFILAGYAGVKYFIVDNVAIVAKLQTEWASEKVYPKKDYKYTDTNAEVTFGVSCYF